MVKHLASTPTLQLWGELISCEGGRIPLKNCTCRCKGTCHGLKRGTERSFFQNTLPVSDPHSFNYDDTPVVVEEKPKRQKKEANGPTVIEQGPFAPVEQTNVQQDKLQTGDDVRILTGLLNGKVGKLLSIIDQSDFPYVVEVEEKRRAYKRESLEKVEQPSSMALVPVVETPAFILKRHDFEPSSYQERIFEFVASGKGNAIVIAGPGSGKSTTILEALKYVDPKIIPMICAFNKSIKEEMSRKIKEANMMASVNTLNGLGHRALTSRGMKRLEDRKYTDLCRAYFQEVKSQVKGNNLLPALRKLVNMVQVTLSDFRDEETLRKLVMQYDIDINVLSEDWKILWPLVEKVLNTGVEMAVSEGIFTFSDQVWLPSVLKMDLEQYPFICVDESQDLNKAQARLVSKSLAPGGRILIVGDPRQGIYRFNGADSQAMPRLQAQFSCQELFLSICYRCPSSHIELANEIFPGSIESRPNAPHGTIRGINYQQLVQKMASGDYVIARRTKDVVGAYFQFIRAQRPATIRGRDIGASLVDLLHKMEHHIEFNPYSIENMPQILEDYRDEQYQILSQYEDKEPKIDAMNDRVDTLQALVDGFMESTAFIRKDMQGLTRFVDSIFNDAGGGVQCATVHKVKGGETNRVAILEYDGMPLQSARTPEAYFEEKCVKYVATTRAKDELFLVSNTSVTDAYIEKRDDVKLLEEAGLF